VSNSCKQDLWYVFIADFVIDRLCNCLRCIKFLELPELVGQVDCVFALLV